MIKFKYFLLQLLFLSIILVSPKVYSTKCSQIICDFDLSAGGNIGVKSNLNDRMNEGITTQGYGLGGRLEFTLKSLFPTGGLRTSLKIEGDTFDGEAGTVFSGLMFQYVNELEMFNSKFVYGAGLGGDYVYAPTKDAASSWKGYTVKLDFRIVLNKLSIGPYLKIQQIIMADVKDPLFVGFGIEVLYRLFTDSPEKEKAKKTKVENPVKIIDPNDSDGDKVSNSKDLCKSTKTGREVDENGCRPIADGMKFEDLVVVNNKLTQKDLIEIKRLVEILKANESIFIVVVVLRKNIENSKIVGNLIINELLKNGIKKSRIKTDYKSGVHSIHFNFLLGL